MARLFDQLFESFGSPMLGEAFDAALTYAAPGGTPTIGVGRLWDEQAQIEADDEGEVVVQFARCTVTDFAVVPLRGGTITVDAVTWSIVSVDPPAGSRYRMLLRREERIERTTRNYRTVRRGAHR